MKNILNKVLTLLRTILLRISLVLNIEVGKQESGETVTPPDKGKTSEVKTEVESEDSGRN